MKIKAKLFFIFGGLLVSAVPVLASTEAGEPTHAIANTFLWLAVILFAAKVASLVERVGQPAVLGELVIGLILGNVVLAGLTIFEPIKQDQFIAFLAELGVVILLFQIGLESNIQKMKQVGLRAFLVACVGVVIPFVLGTYVVGPWLLPGLSFSAYLFLGAILTATSVGITARVFQDLGKLQTKEAQIVLGAAVIDDVLGLIILAIVSAIATGGSASPAMVGFITAEALLFLAAAVFFGQLLAPLVGKYLSKIHSGTGMKLTMALIFCLTFAYLAQKIGLAPIVGAFAAGLVLDPVHFKKFKRPAVVDAITSAMGSDLAKVNAVLEQHQEKHVEDLIQPIAYFLIPVFFVVTGMGVRLETLFNLPILLLALGITVAALVGKVLAGAVAGKVDKWVVGFGMVPRGEVGLIFATMGKSLNVISEEVFSAIVIVIILTTLLTPPILTFLLKRNAAKQAVA